MYRRFQNRRTVRAEFATTSVVFTDEIMPSSKKIINVDADGDGGVVAWIDGTIMKVSTQIESKK